MAQQSRRDFMSYSTLGVLGLALGGGILGTPYLRAHEARLRPPGAVEEDRFWHCALNADSVCKFARTTRFI